MKQIAIVAPFNPRYGGTVPNFNVLSGGTPAYITCTLSQYMCTFNGNLQMCPKQLKQKRNKQTHTDEHTNKQTNKQTNERTNEQTSKQTKQTNTQTICCFYPSSFMHYILLQLLLPISPIMYPKGCYDYISAQTKKPTNKQTSKQTNKQTNEQTPKQTKSNKQTTCCLYPYS